MNALHPLAVYAAVQAHKGEKLDFPGSLGSWIGVSEHSTAMLTGYLTEWAALNEHCKDQKFNAADTSPVSCLSYRKTGLRIAADSSVLTASEQPALVSLQALICCRNLAHRSL